VVVTSGTLAKHFMQI